MDLFLRDYVPKKHEAHMHDICPIMFMFQDGNVTYFCGRLRVLSGLLTWKYLHREIREKGGAYGGGSACQNGVFNFFSYRY